MLKYNLISKVNSLVFKEGDTYFSKYIGKCKHAQSKKKKIKENRTNVDKWCLDIEDILEIKLPPFVYEAEFNDIIAVASFEKKVVGFMVIILHNRFFHAYNEAGTQYGYNNIWWIHVHKSFRQYGIPQKLWKIACKSIQKQAITYEKKVDFKKAIKLIQKNLSVPGAGGGLMYPPAFIKAAPLFVRLNPNEKSKYLLKEFQKTGKKYNIEIH
jgi:ribosomal protein S18 acetylase RimI-like enzyme